MANYKHFNRAIPISTEPNESFNGMTSIIILIHSIVKYVWSCDESVRNTYTFHIFLNMSPAWISYFVILNTCKMGSMKGRISFTQLINKIETKNIN